MITLFDEIEKEGYIILKNLVDPNLIKEFELAARQAWGQESGQYIKQLNRQNKFLVMPKIIDVLMDSQIDYLCRMFLGDEYRYDHLLFIKGDIKNDVRSLVHNSLCKPNTYIFPELGSRYPRLFHHFPHHRIEQLMPYFPVPIG